MPTSVAEKVSGSRPAPLLSVVDLTAGYGLAPVLQNIHIAVAPGEVVCILGPNGAGKSTLLKAVIGEVRVAEGRVTLSGVDITGQKPETLARRSVAYVPQAAAVFDGLTAAENLDMGAYLFSKKETARRRDSLLGIFPELVGILHRPVGRLSGGQRRLVAIARGLMLEPKLLLLDEPTANLSPLAAQSVLRDYVRRAAVAGTAVLLVEQRVREALVASDWAYVMVSGRNDVSSSSKAILRRGDIGQLFLRQADSLRREGGLSE